MSVPGRAEAAALLLSVRPRPKLVRHSRAVAEIAAWLAARIAGRGNPVDRRLVESAALLHDVDKALPPDDPIRAQPHGEGSATWVRRHGASELAPLVANHPVTCLAEGDGQGRWAGFDSLEAAVVAYADKRARQRLIPMSRRFEVWRAKYPVAPRGSADRWSEDRLEEIVARAERLERIVCQIAGVEPEDVERLRWTDRAMAAAAKRVA
jgi:putative nucleotidyltransferase with HDIG domain